MQGTVGRGGAMTIEDSADEGGDLGKCDERAHGDYDPSKSEGAAGNMGEDDGNEREDDVGELAEEAGVELKDSEEYSEEAAEMRAEVHALGAVDEPADQATDDPMDETRDDEDDVEYYVRDDGDDSEDEGN